jgi:hypothetical protein
MAVWAASKRIPYMMASLALRFTVALAQPRGFLERELIFDAEMQSLTLCPLPGASPKLVIMGGLANATVRLPADTDDQSTSC